MAGNMGRNSILLSMGSIRPVSYTHLKATGYEIEIFEQNHSNIDDKLSDLKNIFIKYCPADSSQKERTAILFNIFSLEEDLRKIPIPVIWLPDRPIQLKIRLNSTAGNWLFP